jgi:ATP-dependent DNA helicase RecQ
MDFVPIEENTIASRLKISLAETISQLKMLHQLKIIYYQPRKEQAQIIFLQNRVKREDLRLDIEFIKKRKANLEKKLKAVQFYVTEKNICRTRLLVKYFGEKTDKDCGICDVCTGRKKTSLTNKGFAEIVAALENELKQKPLTAQQIKAKLQIQDADFNQVVDFLTDAGKITWSAELNLTWVG